MPPKGSKGRPAGRTGNANEGNNNNGGDQPIAPTPTKGNSPIPIGEPVVLEASESDSDLNEEDSFKILKKILLNQKISEKKSDERFTKLSKTIRESKRALESYKETNDQKVQSVKQEVDTAANDLKDLKTKVEGLTQNLDQAHEKLNATQKLLDETRQDLKEKAKTIEKLDKKYERDEMELKRCLLLLDGVNEQERRPTTVVNSLLADLGIETKEGDIKATYRLGALKTGIARPRTIKVQFANPKTKAEIFKNIGKIRNNKTWKVVHLSDAMTPLEQRQAKDLRCIYAVGKSKGLDIKLRGNILIIDGVRFGYKDIANLPYDLTMESVKVIDVLDGVAFQSEYAFLSNMYKTEIVYEGNTYSTSEHLYSAEFVKHHDRPELIDDIIAAEDGYAAKRMIKHIKQNETWDNVKYKIMRKIVALKFDQNDSIRDKLLATQGFLYEATKDIDFGCGLTLGQSKDINQKGIKGKNMLGIILCEYRDEYLGIKM